MPRKRGTDQVAVHYPLAAGGATREPSDSALGACRTGKLGAEATCDTPISVPNGVLP